MSYAAAIVSLKTTLAAVSGIRKVVTGYPTSVQAWPLIYMEAAEGERVPNPPNGQVIKNHYRVTATLCVPFQDNAIAEDQIAPYIDSIPLAVRTWSEIAREVAYCISWRTDVRAIGGSQGEAATTYRVVDFVIQIVQKDP